MGRSRRWVAFRPVVYGLVIFGGFVTGLYWALTFVTLAGQSASSAEMPFTGVGDLATAILFFWLITILPALGVSLAHLFVVRLLSARFTGLHLRIASMIVAAPIALLVVAEPRMAGEVLASGTILLLLLALYGWVVGGRFDREHVPSVLDKPLLLLGAGLASILSASFLGVLLYGWAEVLWLR